MHAADEIIERLAREFAASGLGEITFLETLQIPRRLARHLVTNAMHRAWVKLSMKETAANLSNERGGPCSTPSGTSPSGTGD